MSTSSCSILKLLIQSEIFTILKKKVIAESENLITTVKNLWVDVVGCSKGPTLSSRMCMTRSRYNAATMYPKVESLLALTCVVLAATELVWADPERCSGDERPHPQGLCGRRLAQAHSNLCYLLRVVFHSEHYHRDRRSPRFGGGAQGLVQKIYSIPLDVLADFDLSKDDWHVLLAKKKWDINRYFDSDVFPEDMSKAVHESRKRNRHGINSFTKKIVRLLEEGGSKSSDKSLDVTDLHSLARNKRTVVESSNMVCDCCYNACSPEELGTYC